MNPDRISQSGLKTLQVLFVMKDYILTGISNGEIAKRLQESPANINRYLNTLMLQGLVKRREDGMYSLDSGILEFSQSYVREASKINAIMAEINKKLVN